MTCYFFFFLKINEITKSIAKIIKLVKSKAKNPLMWSEGNKISVISTMAMFITRPMTPNVRSRKGRVIKSKIGFTKMCKIPKTTPAKAKDFQNCHPAPSM